MVMKRLCVITAGCLAVLASAGVGLGQGTVTGSANVEQDADGVDDFAIDEALKTEYRRILWRYGLRFSERSLNRESPALKRKEISEEQLLSFFSSIDLFPVSFMKKTGLKNVVFCKTLIHNGSPAAGIASGDTIYLKSVNPGTIYHELFHIVDPVRVNQKWTRLNDRKFTYGGSQFRSANVTPSQRQRLEGEDFSGDFASNYAMSFEWEDRAETFASMLTGPRQFAKRAGASPVLAKKGELMQEISNRISLDMGSEFWNFVAQSDEVSRRKHITERAQANAKLLQEGKPPVIGGFRREK